MFVLGCPIGLRHLPHIVKDQFLRLGHYRSQETPAQIHLIYFSCARDFGLLTLSLKSLRSLALDNLGSVYIVVDSKSPFSTDQEAHLKRGMQKVEFLHLGPIDWASLDTLRTELKAFGIAASAAQPRDFLAKVDSDVLFFSNRKLLEISLCRSDFIGDGHYSRYQYAQGGIYFIRRDLARKLATSVTDHELHAKVRMVHTQAEDQVITALVRERTSSIWLTRVMLFPDEFRRTDFERGWVKDEFSALHFVHEKKAMQHYAERFGIQ